MELIATILICVGFICILGIQIVAMVTCFGKGVGEVLRVFLFPGYALWFACTDAAWARWTMGIGWGALLLGLIIL